MEGVSELPVHVFDEEKLVKLVKRARERWPDFTVMRIVQKKSKTILYFRVEGKTVKLIVYRDGRVRSYSALEGVAIALKKMAMRVLGIDRRVEGAS